MGLQLSTVHEMREAFRSAAACCRFPQASLLGVRDKLSTQALQAGTAGGLLKSVPAVL